VNKIDQMRRKINQMRRKKLKKKMILFCPSLINIQQNKFNLKINK